MAKEETSKEEVELTTASVEEQDDGAFHHDDYLDAPPDGGYGWVCCACVAAMNFAMWGANGSFGILLSFYLESNVFPGATATDYALVVGCVSFLTLFMIPYSSILMLKFGYKPTLIIGIVLQFAGFVGASFAKTIGQLFATQGVLVGISFAIIFGANSIVLPSWFLKKRALANGFSHFGVGAGGMAFSLIVNRLIQKTGNHKWALRTLGICSTVICIITMFLIKVRVPKNSILEKAQEGTIRQVVKSIFDFKVWKSYPLQLAALWASITSIGYLICLFSIANYAVTLGLDSDQSTIILVLLNLGQAVGRPLTGYLSEVFGRVNFTMFATLYTCVLVFAFWISLTTYVELIVFSLMIGLCVGIASVNFPPLVVDAVGINSFPSAFGYANMLNGSCSFIAEICALNLRDYNLVSRNPYFYCQIFVGCIYFLGVFILVPYREWRIQRMLTQRLNSQVIPAEDKEYYEKLSKSKGVGSFLRRATLPWKI